MRENLFAESGLDKWLEDSIKKVTNGYKELQNYVNPQIYDWFNWTVADNEIEENLVKEKDEKLKLWINDSSEKLKNLYSDEIKYNKMGKKFNEREFQIWIDNSHEKLKMLYVSENFKENEEKFNLWIKDSKVFLKEIYVDQNDEQFKLWLVDSHDNLKNIFEKETKEAEEKQKFIVSDFDEWLVDSRLKLIKNYIKENFEENEENFNLWLNDSPDRLKKIYVKEMEKKFNYWRRTFSPMSLSLNSAYLRFAEVFIDKLIEIKVFIYL